MASLSGSAPRVQSPSRPRWLDVALLAALALGIGAPGLGTLTRRDEIESPSEKRLLATWPELRQPASAWRDQLQAYCDDRFGGREWLVRVDSTLHTRLLDTAPQGKVVLGEAGWLYYGDEQRGGLMGLRPLSDAQLEAWVAALHSRQRWAAAIGAHYVLLIAPDKHTIYPEHLPAGYGLPDVTPFDQLLARLASERPEIVVLDVRQALRDAKLRGSVYWPLDTHWDTNGAFVAARAVTQAAHRWFPELAPLELSEVDEVDWPSVERGLADMLAAPEEPPPLPARGLVPRAGPPPVLRAEVFADSFGEALLPLLSLRFECVAPIPLADLLRSDVPATNLVLDVIVERKLARDAPTLPARSAEDLQRVEPSRRFREAPRPLLSLEGAQLARLGVDHARSVTRGPDGLTLSGAGPAVLHLAAERLSAARLYARLELEVRAVPHGFSVLEGGRPRHVSLPPGRHALTFLKAPEEEVRVEVAAEGGSPLSLRVLRLELRGE
ncbi:MAG: hypothetical protein KDD82_15295 [Planctomycetes bacterium]|nr:hypothetical protein [Planctomycetota bacterium]